MVGGRRRLTALAVLVEIVDDRALLEQLRGTLSALRPGEEVAERVVQTARTPISASDPASTSSAGRSSPVSRARTSAASSAPIAIRSADRLSREDRLALGELAGGTLASTCTPS